MLSVILIFTIGIALAAWCLYVGIKGMIQTLFFPETLPKWVRDELAREAAAELPTSRHAFPVIVGDDVPVGDSLDDKTGCYQIIGVQRHTSADVDLQISAASTANARAKAELQGIIVTRIKLLEPANPLDRTAAN